MPSNDIHCVYALIDPLAEELFYVGFTKNPVRRLAKHRKSPRYPEGGRKVKTKIAEIQKKGAQPLLYILERTTNKGQEKIWIQNLRMLGYSLLNRQIPGGVTYPNTNSGREYQRVYGAKWRAQHPDYFRKEQQSNI